VSLRLKRQELAAAIVDRDRARSIARQFNISTGEGPCVDYRFRAALRSLRDAGRHVREAQEACRLAHTAYVEGFEVNYRVDCPKGRLQMWGAALQANGYCGQSATQWLANKMRIPGTTKSGLPASNPMTYADAAAIVQAGARWGARLLIERAPEHNETAIAHVAVAEDSGYPRGTLLEAAEFRNVSPEAAKFFVRILKPGLKSEPVIASSSSKLRKRANDHPLPPPFEWLSAVNKQVPNILRYAHGHGLEGIELPPAEAPFARPFAPILRPPSRIAADAKTFANLAIRRRNEDNFERAREAIEQHLRLNHRDETGRSIFALQDLVEREGYAVAEILQLEESSRAYELVNLLAMAVGNTLKAAFLDPDSRESYDSMLSERSLRQNEIV